MIDSISYLKEVIVSALINCVVILVFLFCFWLEESPDKISF